MWTEELLALVLALFVVVLPAAADDTRLLDRSLFINDPTPGVVTTYKLSFEYNTPAAVGSIDLLACEDPIPYMPCVTPPGLDMSGAVLSDQTGETGFSISTISTNHIILTRLPTVPAIGPMSSYTFDHVVNPTDTAPAFAIRMRTHSSVDATGPKIDIGSVRGQMANGIGIETQVPPILVFCVSGAVDELCRTSDDHFFTDMGELSPDLTLTAQSQMGVGTNASGGFAITVNGTPPAAGTRVINAPIAPTGSIQGTNQFGINLVANSSPSVGHDPEGPFANAFPSPGYDQPNEYKYVDGDTVAYSTNVSLVKKFTVSYILNSAPDLHAGVYSTTLTFTASGRF